MIDSGPGASHLKGMENTLTLSAMTFPEAEIRALARRHDRASGGLMAALNKLGGKAEGWLEKLPGPARAGVLKLTEGALQSAYGLAAKSSGVTPKAGGGQIALSALTGAAGGAAGLASAVAEVPVTVTLILRAIQSVAEDHGFDPASDEVRREALHIFASGGPGEADDGVNSAFIGARLTLTGPAVQRVIATLAPRIAAALGPKLAAQSVPILGAVAGAGLNIAFLRYYREMAQIRFSLLRLAQAHGPEAVTASFNSHLRQPLKLRR